MALISRVLLIFYKQFDWATYWLGSLREKENSVKCYVEEKGADPKRIRAQKLRAVNSMANTPLLLSKFPKPAQPRNRGASISFEIREIPSTFEEKGDENVLTKHPTLVENYVKLAGQQAIEKARNYVLQCIKWALQQMLSIKEAIQTFANDFNKLENASADTINHHAIDELGHVFFEVVFLFSLILSYFD